MSEELSDFFKLISEDKKKKKEDFNEMVGDLGLDSLFNDIAAEKKRIREEKEKQLAKKVEEEKKQKDKFDKIVGEIDVESLFEDLSKIKKESKEEQLAEENRQKKVLTSFENFLTTKIDDIEETKEEIIEEVKAEVVEEVEVESEPEVPTFVEKSLDILNEVSDPLTPPDQNFATLQDLQDHYRKFLVRIQQQLSSLGGGGIEDAPKTGGPYVRQGQKWVVSSGGGGIGTDGSVNTTGIITASSFSGNNLNVTGITTLASAGGITTTGGDLYVGGDLFVLDDIVYDEVDGRNLNISGVATVGTILDVNGTLNVSGISTFNDDVRITDNDKLRFGTSGGGILQVYTNGTNSFFKQISGDLKYELADQFIVQKDSGDEPIAKFNADADVELYYDGSKKLETTATGIDVTGHTETDTLNVSGISTFQGNINLGDNDNINLGHGGDLKIFHDGNANYIVGSNGSLNLKSDSYAYLKGLSSNGKVQIYHGNSKKFETTGIGISVFNGSGDTATIAGPGTLIIDPAIVGDNTGILRIKGDLFVDGTTTQINSTTIEFADFVVGVATTATTNLLTDGAGIGIGSDKTFLYEFNSGSNPSLKSSENLNVSSGKVYQIAETERLSADTLSVGTGATVHSPTSNTLTLGTAGTERLRITSAGNVGIGTNNPAYKIDFGSASNVNNQIRLVQGNGGTALRIGAGGGSNDFTLIRVDGGIGLAGGASNDSAYGFSLKYMGSRSGNANSLSLFSDDQQATPIEAITVFQDGKVGIGHTNPQGTVHISSGTSGDATLILEADTDNNQETDNPYIVFKQDGGISASAIGHGVDSGLDGNGLTIANSISSGFISFQTGTTNGYTNATERLRITSDGKIGIGGETSPEYKVTVYDAGYSGVTIKSNRTTATDNIGGLHFKTQSTNVAYIQSLVDGSIRFRNSSSLTERVRITSAGDVGIGIIDPECRLQVNGDLQVGDSGVPGTFINVVGAGANQSFGIRFGSGAGNPESKFSILGSTNNGDMRFRFGETERVRITSAGNINVLSQHLKIETSGKGIILGSSGNSSIRSDAASDNNIVINAGGSETMRIIGIGGSVGIGITDPECRLQVKGDVQVGDSSSAGHFLNIVGAGSNQLFGVRFGSGAGNPDSKAAILSTTATSGDLIFRTAGDATDRIRIDSNGDVGIGIADPQERLHVARVVMVTGNTPQIRLNANDSDASDNDRTMLGQATANGNFVTTAVDNDTVLRGTTTGNLLFGVGTAEKLRIASNGDLTSTGPDNSFATIKYSSNFTKLDLRGNGIGDSKSYLIGYGAGHSNADDFHMVNGNTNGNLVFRTGSSTDERLRIASDGNVGIGTATPTAKLDVRGTTKTQQLYATGISTIQYNGSSRLVTTSWGMQLSGGTIQFLNSNIENLRSAANDTNSILLKNSTGTALEINHASSNSYIKNNVGDLIIENNGSESLRVKNNGYVGIGSTQPTEELDVVGKVNISDDLFISGPDDRAFFVDASAGRLGVGTKNPTRVLDLVGHGPFTADFQLTQHNSDADAGAFRLRRSRGTAASPTALNNNDGVGSLAYYRYDGTDYRKNAAIEAEVENGDSGLGVKLLFQTSEGTTSAENRLAIMPTGEIGIGKDDPDSLLTIQGTSNLQDLLEFRTSANRRLFIKTPATTGTRDAFQIQTENSLEFVVDSDLAMRIDHDANVGIGTTAPTEKFEVNGKAVITDDFFVPGPDDRAFFVDASAGRLGVGTKTPGRVLDLVGHGPFTADFQLTQHNDNADAGAFRLRRSRGTAASPTALNTNDGVGALAFYRYDGTGYRKNAAVEGDVKDGDSNSGIRLLFQTSEGTTSAENRLVILPNGNIGIGKEDPSVALDVNGTTKTEQLNVTGVSTFANTISVAETIEHTGDTNTSISFPSNDYIRLSTSGSSRLNATPNGYILLGTNTEPSGGDAHSRNARLLIHGRIANSSDSGRLNLQRGSAASFNGSSIGSITFTDSSNNAFARIESLCDGTPGTDDYPGRIVFSTTPDGSTAPTENFRISSDGTSTFSGHVHLGDDDELRFGAGNDFKIVHDPNDCRFENSNGDIKFKNTGSYFFFDEDGGETLASFINDGAVNLYHDNSKKFETVGTGVTVYGDAYIGSDNSRGVILTSPNGTKYRLIVANDGTLSTTSV